MSCFIHFHINPITYWFVEHEDREIWWCENWKSISLNARSNGKLGMMIFQTWQPQELFIMRKVQWILSHKWSMNYSVFRRNEYKTISQENFPLKMITNLSLSRRLITHIVNDPAWRCWCSSWSIWCSRGWNKGSRCAIGPRSHGIQRQNDVLQSSILVQDLLDHMTRWDLHRQGNWRSGVGWNHPNGGRTWNTDRTRLIIYRSYNKYTYIT